MIGTPAPAARSTPTVWLALWLALWLAARAIVTASAEDSCDIVNYGKEKGEGEGVERWVSVRGERRALVLEWSSEAEGAAGALLAAALRLAGYRGTRLRRDARARPLAARAAAPYDRTELLVMLAAQWRAGDVWAAWLRAVGAGVVPVAPRLHRRRGRLAAAPAPVEHEHTKLYVVDEWNGTQSNASKSVSRVELLELVRSDDSEPFMFLDVEVWSDEENVEVVGASSALGARAIRVADNNIWLYSPAVWHLLSYFRPRRADLLHLLTLDALTRRKDPTAAVCEWAATSPHLLARLYHWTDYLNSVRYKHYAFVILCNDTIHEYAYLIDKLEKELFLIEPKYDIDLGTISVDCDVEEGEGAATEDVTRLMGAEVFRRTIGVIGPGRTFSGVQWIARELPLISYSSYGGEADGGGTTSGRPGTVARALRDLLAACRWQRLAVLSDRGSPATELSAALRAADDLNLKDVPLTANRTDRIREVLESLMASDARIFLVNAGARLAGEVMREVANLEPTARTGRVWLVREWAGAGAANHRPVEPYELTFAWRGGAEGSGVRSSVWDELSAPGGAHSKLWGDLSAHWLQRGSWPLYAAPLADAVLALGKGYQDIFQNHQNIYDDVHSNFSAFWNLTETEHISRGVVQKLRFEDRELSSPRVFLYRWSGTRAALLRDWIVGGAGGAGGGGACPLPAPAPGADGSGPCVVSFGDRFDRHCGDWWLLAGVLASMALIPILVMAARRAVRARDAHLVRRTEEMLEARWRAKASRLEPYFVERRALKLHEQIGAGRFGRVWLGFLREPGTTGPRAVEGGAVAAKALREDAAPVEETEFFREARALAALQHEHVVRFVGVCVTDGPPLLLMEYAFFGDLLRYLRARRHLVASDSPEVAQVSAEALTRFARQAATALAYLARRGYVHRDVRAANCLVDERRSLKLADFGMARATRSADGAADGDGDGEYTSRRRALFPVLWMAPESLSRGVFSAASDVWALGVLALELVTLGARPYGSLSPLQVHHFVVTEGRRPPVPRELATEAREALTACWRRAPGERPTAAALAAWLAARPRALQPAPRVPPEDRAEDVDSGIGEPRTRSGSSTSPAHALRSCRFDDVTLYDDDSSLS